MIALVKKWMVTLVCLFAMASFAQAETFKIMTEEYPPFNYTENGKLTGISSEIMMELIQRLGHPDNIKVLPWSRAYALTKGKPGNILFSMTRTEQREDLFKWVGPLATNNWVFFAKKGSGIKINSLDDAHKVAKIGIYKDDAAGLFLQEQGFTNLESVVNDLSNVKKLMADRVQLWIVGYLQGLYKAKMSVGTSDNLEKVFDVKPTQLYIAFSKTAPDAEIAKWQEALDKMKADGTYDAIMKKYL